MAVVAEINDTLFQGAACCCEDFGERRKDVIGPNWVIISPELLCSSLRGPAGAAARGEDQVDNYCRSDLFWTRILSRSSCLHSQSESPETKTFPKIKLEIATSPSSSFPPPPTNCCCRREFPNGVERDSGRSGEKRGLVSRCRPRSLAGLGVRWAAVLSQSVSGRAAVNISRPQVSIPTHVTDLIVISRSKCATSLPSSSTKLKW